MHACVGSVHLYWRGHACFVLVDGGRLFGCQGELNSPPSEAKMQSDKTLGCWE